MKNIETCFVRRGFIRTSTWIVGQGWRNPNVPTISILQLAEWWAHHARTNQTCKESVESFWVWNPGRLPRSLPENGHPLVGGCFRKLDKPMLETVWTGSGTLLYIARPVLERCAKKDRSATGAVDRCGRASVYRPRYTRRNLDGEQALCKSQQPVCERLQPKQTKQLHFISWRK